MNGKFVENIVVNKEVSIFSKNLHGATVDGNGGKAFQITADNVTISGFRIVNSSYAID